jgi:peptide deformylase
LAVPQPLRDRIASVSVRQILQLGNPALRKASSPVQEPDAEAVRRLGADLRDTLLEHRRRTGYGRGIAAPQLDHRLRVVHVELEGSLTLVNPVVTARSEETMEVWDSCFSYFSIAFPVLRHVLVEVAYEDLDGRDRRLETTGHLAELLQHEIDHLDGVLAIDRVTDVRRICSLAEWSRRHAGENDRIVAQAVAGLR